MTVGGYTILKGSVLAIDTSEIDQAANDKLVERLLVEYANKPKSNAEVKIS